MATISERFIIDFINKKIIGTKASFDKASKGSGAIYEELATKVAKHPAFELVIKEQKKRSIVKWSWTPKEKSIVIFPTW